MRTLGAVAFVLVLVSVGPVSAIDSPVSRETLKGIRELKVVIEDIPPDIEREGLTRSQVQTDVELRLRQLGIKVVDTAAGPYLYVNVNALKESGLYAFFLSVEFRQVVVIPRIGTEHPATTWSVANVGTVGVNNFTQFVRGAVRDRVDDFINAFLSVNPKQ